jgi:hypothetical protein
MWRKVATPVGQRFPRFKIAGRRNSNAGGTGGFSTGGRTCATAARIVATAEKTSEIVVKIAGTAAMTAEGATASRTAGIAERMSATGVKTCATAAKTAETAGMV